MRILGADESTVSNYTSHLISDDDFEVLPENWETVRWFLETEDFYRWNGNHCLGLDVVQVKADAKIRRKKITTEQYEDLRFISHIYAGELTKIVRSSCLKSLQELG